MVKQACEREKANNLKFVLVFICYLCGLFLFQLFSIARNTLSREAVEDQDDALEYAGGEFDEDEQVESVRAARDEKKAISVRGKVSSTFRSFFESVSLPSTIDDYRESR